jgi:RNA ligase
MENLRKNLEYRVANKLIRSVQEGPYTLYDYTERCQQEKLWDEYTMAARGLILNDKDEIVCRPFRKFFNHSELSPKIRASLPPINEAVVMDKMDGSLGCVWHDRVNNRWRCSTRGSFNSEQALWANKFMDHYGWDYNLNLNPRNTYLFEIIYPENKIVVDYKGANCMAYLATIHNESGYSSIIPDMPHGEYGIIHTKQHKKSYLDIQQDLVSLVNHEGYVIWWPVQDIRVKMKAVEYLRLHKIRNSITPLGVYEMFISEEEYQHYADQIPDEFINEFNRYWNYFEQKYREGMTEITTKMAMYRHAFRKVYAEQVQKILSAHLHAGAFAYYDKQPILRKSIVSKFRPFANKLV